MSVDAPHVSPLEMLQDISRFAAGPQRDLLSQMFQTMQMVQMLQIINTRKWRRICYEFG